MNNSQLRALLFLVLLASFLSWQFVKCHQVREAKFLDVVNNIEDRTRWTHGPHTNGEPPLLKFYSTRQAQIESENSDLNRLRALANSYFRIGQQAALLARDVSEARARAVRQRYGYTDCDNGHYTNQADFEIVTERVNCIDHPRIWEMLRLLNNGSVLGLDTNSQCEWTNNKPWTVLRDP